MGKAFRKAEDKVSDFFRPVNKTLRKTGIGKILPYASMALPFFAPGFFGGGIGELARRYLIPQALTATGRSIEGKKFSPLAQGITAAASFVGGPSGGTGSTKLNLEGKSFLDKAKTTGNKIGDFVKDAVQEDTFSQLKAAGTIGAAMGASDAYDSAKKAEEDFRKRYEGSAEGYDDAVLKYLRSYMANAGYSNDEIQNYLSNRYMYAANGGRVGFADGGSGLAMKVGGYGGYRGDEQDRADYEDGEYFKLMTFEDYLTMLDELQQESKNESFYKKGGRVGFGDGGTSNRESSGIIEMEMIDPETGQKKQFFGSLYDEDIMSGIITGSITPLETHPLLEGMKKGGRVGLAFGGDPEDIPTLDNDLGEDEILQILKDGYADNAGGGLGKMQQQLIQLGVDTSKMSPTEIIEIYNRMMGGESGKYFGAKKGGRVGFAEGGTEDRNKMSKLMFQLANAVSDTEKRNILSKILLVKAQGKKEGGIASLEMGGMPSMEMDYRGGGFIPVGSKEKADDVPARLSKNEFVMTADAVRAAGGGSVNKGAQKMYQLMNQLEAKV